MEVHADLSPFRRDLNRELKRAVTSFEKELNKALGVSLQQEAEASGQRIGVKLGRGASRGLKKEMVDNASIWTDIGATLGTAIGRGLSALPPEVKLALLGGALAASPLIAGALAAAVTAGVGLAVAGIGAALASQFESVQVGWRELGSDLRLTLVEAASAFEPVMLRVFDLIELRVERMAPMIGRIFDVSATFLEPFVGRALDALERFLVHLERTMGDIGPFVDELGDGLVTLADAAGVALNVIASTGQDGREAFRDMVAIIASLVVGFALLINALTKVWGLIRDTARLFAESPWPVQALFPLAAGFGHVANAIDDTSRANEAYFLTNVEMVDSQGRVITQTKEEIAALKNLASVIKAAADAALGAIDANVDYERSIDSLEEALKRGGANINITTKAGQDTVEAFAKSLGGLTEQLEKRVLTGELTTQQAVAQYNKEIERLEALANAAGITDRQFYDLYGTAIILGELQIAPETAGIDATTATVEELNQALREAIALAKHLAGVTIGGALLGARGYAEGGVIDQPTLALMGEGNRREVVIPLTKPARAAELMRETGLDRMASGDTQVMVFIGDEQLEGRMVRVAQRVSGQQGLALAQGFRGL